MLWLGLTLSLAGGASIHSQQAAMHVGQEQMVVAEETEGCCIRPCLQPGDVPTADGGIGPPRSSDVQTVDGGIRPPRSSDVQTVDGGIGPPRSSDVQTVDGGIGPPRSSDVQTVDGGIGPPARG